MELRFGSVIGFFCSKGAHYKGATMRKLVGLFCHIFVFLEFYTSAIGKVNVAEEVEC